METIGFIGLGRMGRPMASNLCRKGFRVIAYDVNPAAVVELAALQARPAKDVAEVARSSTAIVTMLPDPKAVETVVLGPDGILSQAVSGSLIMDMSTIRSRCRANTSTSL